MELKFEVNTQEIIDKVLEKLKDDFIPKLVIEDIKAEIASARNALEVHGQMDEVHALNFAIQIIDKHISGKENE